MANGCDSPLVKRVDFMQTVEVKNATVHGTI